MIKQLLIYCAISSLIVSCTVDRTFTIPAAATGPGGSDSIVNGTIVINEFEATGSQFFNELVLPGNPNGGSDWFELYNTTNDTISFESGKWYVTDSLPFNNQYKLPAFKIAPKKFQVIWCDGLDTVATQIHTNFSLSKSGEQIGLFHKNASNELIQIDALTYTTQSSGLSFGRLPDGSSNWNTFNNPTPGNSNH